MRARLLTVLFLALFAPAAAQAATSADKISYKVFSDYAKDGTLDPCQYTTHELQIALDHITPDVRQYASDYPDAVKAAIASRARGGCDAGTNSTAPATSVPPAGSAPGATPPPATTTSSTGGTTAGLIAAPTTSEPPGPGDPSSATDGAGTTASDAELRRAAARSPDNGAPAPLIGLGILALVAAMLAALMLAVRRLGAGEGRLAPVYHSWREARWRAGGVWADFADWLRLGR